MFNKILATLKNGFAKDTHEQLNCLLAYYPLLNKRVFSVKIVHRKNSTQIYFKFSFHYNSLCGLKHNLLQMVQIHTKSFGIKQER